MTSHANQRSFDEIARIDGRFSARALTFVHDSLLHTVAVNRPQDPEDPNHHISGRQLAAGMAQLAGEKWGRMAKTVLNQWGIFSTRDIGEIVYLLIRHNWLTAQESDRIEDFDNVFDFETYFEKNYRFETENI